MDYLPHSSFPDRRTQSGIVLFIALIALVILSLAGISLFRALNASSLISGNLAYRQAALSASDIGVENAITTLSTLSEDQRWGTTPVTGYWAIRQSAFDPFAPCWKTNADGECTETSWTDANSILVPSASSAGNSIRYVIHRLCDQTGGPAKVDSRCSTAPPAVAGVAGGGDGSSRKVYGYGEGTPDPETTNSPYYRITTRVEGTRNSVAYTQVMVYFQ